MAENLTCEEVTQTIRDASSGLPDNGFLEAVRKHVARCPHCAHLPGVERIFREVKSENAPLSRSVPTPVPVPAPKPAETADRSAGTESGGPLLTLMVFGAVVALAFAARSAGQAIDALQRPPDVRNLTLQIEKKVPAGEASEFLADAEVVASVLRGVCEEAIPYLERLRRADTPEERGALSKELRSELEVPGLVPRIRVLRKSPKAPSPNRLQRLEAIFLRAAAAGETGKEWLMIQRYVEHYDLVSSCRRFLDTLKRSAKP